MKEVTRDFILSHVEEELQELIDTPGDVRELADLIGVLIHYAVVQGWSPLKIEREMLHKFQQRFTLPTPIDPDKFWDEMRHGSRDPGAPPSDADLADFLFQAENGTDWAIVGKDAETIIRELQKAREFKAFVHAWLDKAGVPTHPDGPHAAEGCRVGERLALLERTIRERCAAASLKRAAEYDDAAEAADNLEINESAAHACREVAAEITAEITKVCTECGGSGEIGTGPNDITDWDKCPQCGGKDRKNSENGASK